MVLVVLFHVAGRFDYDFGTRMQAPWLVASGMFGPVRMPLFFFISGFLVANSLSRVWANTRGRTLGFVYLYVLWTLIFMVRIVPDVMRGGLDQPWGLALSFLLPTSFWYLYALPLYFVSAWLLKKSLGKHSAYALIPLLAISATAYLLEPTTQAILQGPLDPLKVPDVLRNFVWFYLGVHGKSLWLSIIDSSSVIKTVAATVGFGVLYLLAALTGTTEPLRAPLSVAALYMSALVLGQWNTQLQVGSLLRKVGRQTLPVYVLHIFLVPVIMAALNATGALALMRNNAALWNVVAPPLVTAVVVYLAFKAGQIILASKAAWLFSAPVWVTKRKVEPASLKSEPVSGN